jgi:hypothetical protein
MSYRFIFLLLLLLLGIACDSRVRWNETYEHQLSDANVSPMDVSMLRALLPSAKFKVKDIKAKLAFSLPKEGTNENYIFIGEAIELDSNDAKHLKNFIERGNTALIISKYISKRLLRGYFSESNTPQQLEAEMLAAENEPDDEWATNETADTAMANDAKVPPPYANYSNEYLNFKDSVLTVCSFFPDTFCYNTGYYNAIMESRFPANYYHFDHFFSQNLLKGAIPMGNVQKQWNNFLLLPYGKGRLLLHSMPILFTNIEIQNKQGKTYIEKILGLLKGEQIYWDKANQTNINNARKLDLETSPFQQANNNILKYVIGHESLAYAWFTLLAIAVLFLLFGAKRRQRIIPVLPNKTSNTLNYLQALGRLYFFQQNHTALAKMKFKHFQAFVRQHYSIPTTRLDSKFVEKLAQKSNVPMQYINAILEDAIYAEQFAIDEQHLTKLHKNLEYFYKNCRK